MTPHQIQSDVLTVEAQGWGVQAMVRYSRMLSLPLVSHVYHFKRLSPRLDQAVKHLPRGEARGGTVRSL
jgi:hypothetical protein